MDVRGSAWNWRDMAYAKGADAGAGPKADHVRTDAIRTSYLFRKLLNYCRTRRQLFVILSTFTDAARLLPN